MTAQSTSPCILALDIGTSGARALFFDRRGQEVEGSGWRQPYQFQVFPDGGVEIEAGLVLESVVRCVDQAADWAKKNVLEIAGVALCTFVSNVLGIDAQGRLVTPVYPYADTRPALEVQALRGKLDEAQTHQRTGCYFHTSYLPARFLWLEKNQPELVRKAWRWVSLGELLFLRLFGSTQVSFSVASWTGLLNRFAHEWDAEMLSWLPIGAGQLSPLCDLNQPMQGLLPEFARRWPGLAHVPWFPALGDGAAANIGSGCIRPAQAAISMGSTCAVRAVVEAAIPDVPGGLWCYRVDGKRSLLGGALTEGGNFFNWMRRVLKLEGKQNPEDLLLGREPGSHGLAFLPLLAGERSPGWNAEARGAISGLTLATTPLDVLQAGLEGVICRIAQVYRLLAQALPGQPQAIASGGGAQHSRFLAAGLADALGQPVFISQAREASARGAALLALESLGLVDDLSELVSLPEVVYQPDAKRHARYAEMIDNLQTLYHQVVRPPAS